MEFKAANRSQYPLRLTATNAPMSYKLYEVSACTVGILALEKLTERDYLVMEAEGRRIPLRVAEILNPIKPKIGPVIQRYRLTCLDILMDLDRLLTADESSEQSLQFARCPVNPRIYVEAIWPGRNRVELLESVDISRSGLLLRVSKGTDFAPLVPNQMAPLRLDVARLWLPESLEPTARIVRVWNSQEEFKTFSYIAVQLVDLTTREADDWNRLLRRIERGFLPGLSRVA